MAVSIVVTRRQDLASEFSKLSGLIPPDPHSKRGRPIPHPTPNTSVLGPKPSSPSTFQPWLRPCAETQLMYRVWVVSVGLIRPMERARILVRGPHPRYKRSCFQAIPEICTKWTQNVLSSPLATKFNSL